MILIADYYIYKLNEKDYKKYGADVNLIDGVIKISDAHYENIGRPELVIDIFGETLVISLDNYRFEHKKQQGYYTAELSHSDRQELKKILEKYKKILE